MSQPIGVCGLGWPLELLEGVGEFAARWHEAAVEWDRLDPLHGLETRAIAFVVSYPPTTTAIAVDPDLEKIGAMTWAVPTPPVLWVKVDVARPPTFSPVDCGNLGATIAYEWHPPGDREPEDKLPPAPPRTGHWVEYRQHEIPSPQRGQKATEAWLKLRGFRHSAARLNARGGLRKFVRAVIEQRLPGELLTRTGHVTLDPSDRRDPWPDPRGKLDTGPL